MTRSAAFQPISIQATPEKVGTGFSSGVAANQAYTHMDQIGVTAAINHA
jgi:hypothetical protein